MSRAGGHPVAVPQRNLRSDGCFSLWWVVAGVLLLGLLLGGCWLLRGRGDVRGAVVLQVAEGRGLTDCVGVGRDAGARPGRKVTVGSGDVGESFGRLRSVADADEAVEYLSPTLGAAAARATVARVASSRGSECILVFDIGLPEQERYEFVVARGPSAAVTKDRLERDDWTVLLD